MDVVFQGKLFSCHSILYLTSKLAISLAYYHILKREIVLIRFQSSSEYFSNKIKK